MQKRTLKPCWRLRIASALTGLSMLLPTTCLSHDYWSNGKKVPDWVKASCCGEADAHLLRPDQVGQSEVNGKLVWRIHMDDGRVIDVEYNKALPSQDGNYWIFCTDAKDPPVYCFFAPLDL